MNLRSFSLFLFLLFSLCTASLATAQSPLPTPTGLRVEAFQHELVLHWKAAGQSQWEVQLDEQAPIRVSQPTHTFTRLPQEQAHTLKVRAVNGDQSSDFAPIQTATKPLKWGIDAPQRVPYLRSIRIDGVAPKRLPLFYNELANLQATITYKFNGQPIEPVDEHLLLSSTAYKDKLEIHIDEGEGRQWNIVYLISLER